MRIRVHQLLVALPLTLVSALGIAVGVQSFSLESADLLSVAPADDPLPADAIRGSVEGVVPPPPARPAEPAIAAPVPDTPSGRGIIGFTAPAGGPNPGAANPAGANAVNAPVKLKAPAARSQRPKAAARPSQDPNCRPADRTLRRLPNPTVTSRSGSRERAVSGPASGTPVLPNSVPARNSAGLPAGGSTVPGLVNHPSTSRPGPSISGPGPSIPRSGASQTPVGRSEGTQVPDGMQWSDQTEPVAVDQFGPSDMATDAAQPQPGPAGAQGTPRAAQQPGSQPADCSGPDPRGRRRVPVTEPVVARDPGQATPARSGW